MDGAADLIADLGRVPDFIQDAVIRRHHVMGRDVGAASPLNLRRLGVRANDGQRVEFLQVEG